MGPLPRRQKPLHRRWEHLGDFRRRQPDLDHPGARALYRRQHQATSRRSVRLRKSAMKNRDLNPEQVRDLRALAGAIIPPSATYPVPAAAANLIFGDTLTPPDPPPAAL